LQLIEQQFTYKILIFVGFLLLQTLFAAAMRGDGNPYVKITRENQRAAARLRPFGFIEDHPHNSKAVKLISPE